MSALVSSVCPTRCEAHPAAAAAVRSLSGVHTSVHTKAAALRKALIAAGALKRLFAAVGSPMRRQVVAARKSLRALLALKWAVPLSCVTFGVNSQVIFPRKLAIAVDTGEAHGQC